MIVFACPKCREALSIPLDVAADTASCPNCDNVTIVPRPQAPVEAELSLTGIISLIVGATGFVVLWQPIILDIAFWFLVAGLALGVFGTIVAAATRKISVFLPLAGFLISAMGFITMITIDGAFRSLVSLRW